jgi:glutathione S-transferase
MITLYELHWSHYCEKIRWALDYKKLSWKSVNINAFTKKEIKYFSTTQKRHLVPFIYDDETKMVVDDSSRILNYLEDYYPDSPPLFPKDPIQRKNINQFLIELDSKLALIGRKLGYSQIILEKPTILSRLFLSDQYNGIFNLPVVRHFSSFFLGMILIKRFSFHLNESTYLYEALEQYLLQIANNLKDSFVMYEHFSAADITLAVYLRPLSIIPFFRENPQLKLLFDWQEKIMGEHHRDKQLLYQELMEQHRKVSFPVRRKIKSFFKKSEFLNYIDEELKKNTVAFNDHEPIWTWSSVWLPFYYLFKIKENKVRKKYATDKIR